MAIGAAPTRSADTQSRVLSAALVSCLRTPERHAHTKTEENIKKHNLCIKKQKTEYARICKIMFLLDNLLVANMQDYARLCFMFFYVFLCFMFFYVFLCFFMRDSTRLTRKARSLLVMIVRSSIWQKKLRFDSFDSGSSKILCAYVHTYVGSYCLYAALSGGGRAPSMLRRQTLSRKVRVIKGTALSRGACDTADNRIYAFFPHLLGSVRFSS